MRRRLVSSAAMRRALLVVLILLVIMTGLPVLSAMDGMTACATCERAATMSMLCPAVLAAAAGLFISLLRQRAVARGRRLTPRLHAVLHERPPQLARA